MKNSLTGFLVALIVVLLLVVWNSFPFHPLYVSDMTNLKVLTWFWSKPQMDRSVDGNSLIVHERVYPKGIGVHAPTQIEIPTPRGYSHFVADVGVSDEAPPDSLASVVFRVWGDGAILYESPLVKAGMPPYRVDVNVQWTGKIMLEVTDGGDGTQSDHAIWGNACFVHR